MEIIPSKYNYSALYRCTTKIIEKLIPKKKVLSQKEIIVAKSFHIEILIKLKVYETGM